MMIVEMINTYTLFVNIDEIIKVDTRTGEYVSRVKE